MNKLEKEFAEALDKQGVPYSHHESKGGDLLIWCSRHNESTPHRYGYNLLTGHWLTCIACESEGEVHPPALKLVVK